MKVGLNLMFLVDEAGGAGRYATELVPGLLEADRDLRLTVFVNRDVPGALSEAEWAGDVEWVRLPTRFANRTHLVGQLTALPAIAARRGLDVVHSLANGGPPVTPRARRVVTLLDLIWLHQREAWGSATAVRTMAVLTRLSARTAHRVITISEAARDDLVWSFGLDRGKIDVTPLGVRVPVARAARRDDGRTVLCVAQKRPYKNLAVLIHAIADLREEGVRLVLPGAPTPYEGELRALVARLGVTGRVGFLGWVDDDELEALYAEATCFVLPSLIEGFGLPVLEAMARGVPVACSDRPALPEVAGDAALLFDPADQASVTAAVRRLIAEPALRESLASRGLERARQFTWRRTAEETLASYRRAVGQ